MPEFTYNEVSEEVKRLALPWAKDEDFTENEITDAVSSLNDWELSTVVANLKVKKVTADTLAAFAKLAATLGASVNTAYEGLEISRDTTPDERRASAVQSLRSKANERNREAARLSLERQLHAL